MFDGEAVEILGLIVDLVCLIVSLCQLWLIKPETCSKRRSVLHS